MGQDWAWRSTERSWKNTRGRSDALFLFEAVELLDAVQLGSHVLCRFDQDGRRIIQKFLSQHGIGC